jgi:hypothetical protein
MAVSFMHTGTSDATNITLKPNVNTEIIHSKQNSTEILQSQMLFREMKVS